MAAWRFSSTAMKTDITLCHECDRGGRGNAADKCALVCHAQGPVTAHPGPEVAHDSHS